MTAPKGKRLVVYGLVLLAAVVGLLIDRLHFSPSPAKGEDPVRPASTFVVAPSEPDQGDAAGPPIAPLFRSANGQAAASTVSPVRDAFAASPEMEEHYGRRRTKRGTQPGAGGEEPEVPIDAEAFLAKHKLHATSVQQKKSWAMIDDRVMRVGDNIDGFVLRRIDHYRVTFEGQDGSIDLVIAVGFGAKVPGTEPR
jgi:hypothetical protein